MAFSYQLSRLVVSCFLTFLAFSFLPFSILAQSNSVAKDPYLSAWTKIDRLIQEEGKYQDALREVNKLGLLAKKQKQSAHAIKALIYRIELSDQVVESATPSTILALEKEINNKQTTFTERAVLNSMLAYQYWQYLQMNRYSLGNRTANDQEKKEDVSTWSIPTIERKILDILRASLQQPEQLFQQSTSSWGPLLKKNKEADNPLPEVNLQPTLLHLLTFRAIRYYDQMNWVGNSVPIGRYTGASIQSKPNNIPNSGKNTGISYAIREAAALEPADQFIRFKFPTSDSAHPHFQAIMAFQNLLKLHLLRNNEKNQDYSFALVDADIQRLQFMRQHSLIVQKNKKWELALNHLAHQYGKHPAAAAPWLMLAEYDEEQASIFTVQKDSLFHNRRIKALEKIEKVLSFFPNYEESPEEKNKLPQSPFNEQAKIYPEYYARAINLKRQIEAVQLNLQTDAFQIPQTPFLALVQYRNISKLYGRIVRLTPVLKEKLESNALQNETYWQSLVSLSAFHEFNYTLPAAQDHFEHSAEIKLPGLNNGHYLLLLSSSPKFDLKTDILSGTLLDVTHIAFVQKNKHLYVLNRETGAPLANAQIQVFHRIYNSVSNTLVPTLHQTITSNQNGYALLEPSEKYNNLEFIIQHGIDRIAASGNAVRFEWKPNNQKEKNKLNGNIFTDRSIYRPGQSVLFKVLLYEGENRNKKILPNHKFTILLYDANRKKVEEITAQTNHLGSFSQQFQLPSGKLNGQFSLEIKNSEVRQSFRVEEYKRPTFYVEIDQNNEVKKLGDSISISGKLVSYAGGILQGTELTYTVRKSKVQWYPLFGSGFFQSYSSRIWPPVGNQGEIVASGTTFAENDGKYSFSFGTYTDPGEIDPNFSYEVAIQATINGEAQEKSTNFLLSNKSLFVSLLPEFSNNKKQPPFRIKVTNSFGVEQKVPLQISLKKLQGPTHLLRKRNWSTPDQFVMDYSTFKGQFPLDVYAQEDDPNFWNPIPDSILQISGESLPPSDHRSTNAYFAGFQSKNEFQLSAGWYQISIQTKDSDGNSIEWKEAIPFQPEDITFKYTLNLQTPSEKFEPGQNFIPNLQTNLNKAWLYQSVDKQDGLALAVLPPADSSQWIATPEKNPKRRKKENLNTTSDSPNGMGNKKDSTLGYKLESRPLPSIPIEEKDRGGFGVEVFTVKHNRFYSSMVQPMVPWSNKKLSLKTESFRSKLDPGQMETWKISISSPSKDSIEVLSSMFDASLDALEMHRWNLPVWFTYSQNSPWLSYHSFAQKYSQNFYQYPEMVQGSGKNYFELLEPQSPFSGGILHNDEIVVVGYGVKKMVNSRVSSSVTVESLAGKVPGVVVNEAGLDDVPSENALQNSAGNTPNGETNEIENNGLNNGNAPVSLRKNKAETAFFFPHLTADENGSITVEFKVPEALTRWRWMNIAHNKNLATGYLELEAQTQKKLMVQPGLPRVLRQGDRVELTALISNLTDSAITGQAELQLVDPETNTPVDGWFQNIMPNQYFSAKARSNSLLNFSITIPHQYSKPLLIRIYARGAGHTDGEENLLPVLSNKLLVKESLPLFIQQDGEKKFEFFNLLNSGKSGTLTHQLLQVELYSNPTWIVLNALPILQSIDYPSSDQYTKKFFAQVVISSLMEKQPLLKKYLLGLNLNDTSQWQTTLSKNPALRDMLLEETPWVLEADKEKENLMLLVQWAKQSEATQEINRVWQELKTYQNPSGGFSWFKAGIPSVFQTMEIVHTLSKLHREKLLPTSLKTEVEEVIKKGWRYLDGEWLKAIKVSKIKGSDPYRLYVRSYFPLNFFDENQEIKTAYQNMRSKVFGEWTKFSRLEQGMIAIAVLRNQEKSRAGKILEALKQQSITTEMSGMYWKNNKSSWYYRETPLYFHTLMIEAFSEGGEEEVTGKLKTWLLLQKQTQSWSSNMATISACYALLLKGGNWLAAQPTLKIKLGDLPSWQPVENPTQYHQWMIPTEKIKAEYGQVTLIKEKSKEQADQKSNSNPPPVWGAVHWQYFEEVEKINEAAAVMPGESGWKNILQISRKYFVRKIKDGQDFLEEINNLTELKPGDKIISRLILTAGRNMEYVALTDQRGALLEPTQKRSGHRWQKGLGYYQNIKDISTQYYFEYLPQGTHVLEYEAVLTHKGVFSSGIATVQCLYAPEFRAHSAGAVIRTAD